MSKQPGNRKTRVGIVVSTKMDKTIVVSIERRIRHPLYGKEIRKSKKLNVHDEAGSAQIGDKVRVRETRPISKTKCWTLDEVMRHDD